MLEIPRIAGRAVESGFRRRHEPKLGDVCLAEDDEPRRLVPRSQQGIVRTWYRWHELRALTRRQAFGERTDVLEKEGYAGEATLRQFSAGFLPCPFIVVVDDEVELGIELFRPRDRFVHELYWLDLAVVDQFGESQAVQVLIFRKRHSTLP